ncbi:MAG: 23S rRNA (pseudouridine(1915)-N(3))-methyltransferase RlmH [Erysipelotrichaceae bacterium]|nr:23S rRNA (pseudouridine(1915)-N(3))-methyltransferase RlmH [Erysipelotrichaceae bacterium]MBQ1522071.1 23S rRNA (pseudouridine(1915)-N(3))-methyltransferase RlmH [Erysipelotrichaceae bacterium]MBR2745383.1 23S rRNA (pseudouridine(1915)-N(3))-methyltransferase RlmH [Erysipelotrichaceae bacterium]
MITVIAVGKLKEKAYKDLVDEYVKRLSAYTKVEIIEVADETNQLEEAKVKKLEGERILKAIKKDSFTVLLDLRGRMLNSNELSLKIQEINTYHSSNITFIIGGSLGVSDEVYSRADYKWKLSDLTFPHNLVRVILLEQIYRSYKIMNNEPYHK